MYHHVSFPSSRQVSCPPGGSPVTGFMSEDWLNIKIPNEKTPNLLERAGMVGVEPGSRRAPKSPKKTPKKYKKRKKAEMLPLPPTELEEYVILMSAIDISGSGSGPFSADWPQDFPETVQGATAKRKIYGDHAHGANRFLERSRWRP